MKAKFNSLVDSFKRMGQMVNIQGGIIDAIINIEGYSPEQIQTELDAIAERAKTPPEQRQRRDCTTCRHSINNGDTPCPADKLLVCRNEDGSWNYGDWEPVDESEEDTEPGTTGVQPTDSKINDHDA